jgi:hypothetical protein
MFFLKVEVDLFFSEVMGESFFCQEIMVKQIFLLGKLGCKTFFCQEIKVDIFVFLRAEDGIFFLLRLVGGFFFLLIHPPPSVSYGPPLST